ncbi:MULTISPECIES: hypothetical protein [Listeria]|uniref:hypothetical protein n=1 Tax=Listeria TaxID=1637 RepID=UPI000B587ACE|nr:MULTISPECIES: hypothetical protein [Listeria]
MHFQRLINSKDLEFYRVAEQSNREKAFGYLVIYDKREPAVLKDFTVFYKSSIEPKIFEESLKKNHIYVLFFHFTDIEDVDEMPKFSKVIHFIEDLLKFNESSYYMDNYLIQKNLYFECPLEYEKIGEFLQYLEEVSKRKIPYFKTERKKYLNLSQ